MEGTDDRNIAEVVVRNARRLNKMADDILDVTRIESHTLNLRKERFNLSETLQKTILDFENRIRNESKENCRPIEIRYDVMEQSNGNNNHLMVEADLTRICQVLSNLFNNAYASVINTKGHEAKCIGVSLAKEEKKEQQHNPNQGKREKVAVISICDDGKGIEAEIASKLFTKFNTGWYGGIGLGLYIAKSIIEAHGGEIWCENNNDGKGATFSFSLPLA
jgi:signal transduction histidine kinase